MEQISISCPRCGTLTRATAQFCSKCGMSLHPASPPVPEVTQKLDAPRVPREIGKYQVRGPWAHDELVLTLTRPGMSEAYLALPLPKRLPPAPLQQLQALAATNQDETAGIFCPVVEQAQKDRHWYLIVRAPQGTRLDQMLVPLQGDRALYIFSQLKNILTRFELKGWVTTIPIPKINTRVFPFPNTRFRDWFSRMSETMRAQLQDISLNRFRHCFMVDEFDHVQLFDYTGWETLPTDVQEQLHRTERDLILATRTMHWLYSAKPLGRLFPEIKGGADVRNQVVLEVFNNLPVAHERIDELLRKTMPSPSSTTVPLSQPTARLSALGQLTAKLNHQLEAHGETDKGDTREKNEDSMLVLPLGDQGGAGFYVVADGLGGHADGKIASETVIASLEQSARAEWESLTHAESDQVQAALTRWIQRANQRVLDAAYARSSNMGSTLTAAFILGERAWVANVGDSRTYFWSGNQLAQVTRDHSLVASLVASNLLTEEEIYTHPQRNQIFRSLGLDAQVQIDLFPLQLGVGDGLLLCSDGLWEMIRNPQMENALRAQPDLPNACKALVALANKNGGEDNITVVLVRWR